MHALGTRGLFLVCYFGTTQKEKRLLLWDYPNYWKLLGVITDLFPIYLNDDTVRKSGVRLVGYHKEHHIAGN